MRDPLPFPSAARVETPAVEATLSQSTTLPPSSALAAPVVIRVVDPYARFKLAWAIVKVLFVLWLVYSFLHAPLQTVKFLVWDLPSFLLGITR